jgi:Tfp pilus assembly protein PilO
MSTPATNPNRLLQQTHSYGRIQWMLGSALVLAVALFYLMVYRPQSAQLEEFDRQTEFKKSELATDRSQTDKLPRVTVELADLKRRLAGFKRLPPDPQFGQFIHDINQISQNAALQKFNEEPGTPRRLQLFSEQPVTLSFEGNFPSVFQFIGKLEDMQRLTRLRDVTIKALDDHSGLVDVKLSINIYFGEAPADAMSAAASAGGQ